jgi:3-oxoacyl-[acyl-carrier protein] reductase
MTGGLREKNVLIFGASSGIGAAVATHFGRAGARVMVHYNAGASGAAVVADAIRAGGGWAEVIGGDVSEREEGPRIVDESLQRMGGLDVVINNAGAIFGRTFISETSDEQFNRVVALNIGGVFFAARRAARIMQAKRAGTIINTTSIAARTGGGEGSGLYGSAKAFVSTLTRVLAKELAPSGVRVNAVAPGVILTPLHERESSSVQIAAALSTIPLGRVGTAEDCVGAFEFLADETMSGYITGQIIEVNGGQLMP